VVNEYGAVRGMGPGRKKLSRPAVSPLREGSEGGGTGDKRAWKVFSSHPCLRVRLCRVGLTGGRGHARFAFGGGDGMKRGAGWTPSATPLGAWSPPSATPSGARLCLWERACALGYAFGDALCPRLRLRERAWGGGGWGSGWEKSSHSSPPGMRVGYEGAFWLPLITGVTCIAFGRKRVKRKSF
jgi:hypothetical protein